MVVKKSSQALSADGLPSPLLDYAFDITRRTLRACPTITPMAAGQHDAVGRCGEYISGSPACVAGEQNAGEWRARWPSCGSAGNIWAAC
jgi:hypothetical protein